MTDNIIDENITTMIEIIVAAREYSLYGPHFIGPLNRLVIGNYQIGQGIRWRGTPSEYESYAAAIIHFVGGHEQIIDHRKDNLDLCQCYHGVNIHKKYPVHGVNYMTLFERCAMVFQLAHYHCNSSTSGHRASRFVAKEFTAAIFDTTYMLFKAIPWNCRQESFVLAWNIMNGVL